jgi:hypothetical protein
MPSAASVVGLFFVAILVVVSRFLHENGFGLLIVGLN